MATGMKWGSDHLRLICGKRSVRIVENFKVWGDNDEYPLSSRLKTRMSGFVRRVM